VAVRDGAAAVRDGGAPLPADWPLALPPLALPPLALALAALVSASRRGPTPSFSLILF